MGEIEILTIEQIKKAFWLTFHQSGELWFPSVSSYKVNMDKEKEEKKCNEATEDYWLEFLENLNKEEVPKE